MARYATYPATTAPPLTRKWLFRALFLSLLLHAGFFVFAYLKKLENFGFTNTERLAPPRFVVKQSTIDPKLLDPPEEVRTTMAASNPIPQHLPMPIEKPEPKEIQLKPDVTEVIAPLLKEDPTPKPINWDDLVKTDAISAGNDDKQVGALASMLLKDSVPAPNQRVVRIPNMKRGGDSADGSEGIPGKQSLDAALARTGPLPAGDNIALHGGALFDYDSAELRPDALDEMQKLGELIRRNPRAVFRIEGHTDAIGSREYNLVLSQRRADAMKAWLVVNLGVEPSRVETVGFGPDNLLVPGNLSIEEQQPNRRVEIVIKTNRGR